MSKPPAKIPTNFKQFIDPIRGSKPEDIIVQTEIDVSSFIESEFKPKPKQAILILEKKARLLFQPFLNRLVVKGYSPIFVRKLQQAVWTKGGLVSKKYSLLTDWINTGDEIASLISHLATKKRVIDKVYCYAACEDTMEKLASGPLKSTPIVVWNKIKSGDPTNFSRRLQAYYQCLLDPIDIDNAYDIYQVGAPMVADDLKQIVALACQTVLGQPVQFENSDHHFLPTNMESIHYEVKDLCLVTDPPLQSKIKYLLTKIEFDYPNITLKTLAQKGAFKFSIDCCFPTSPLHRNSLKPEKGCNICQTHQCYLRLNKSNVPIKEIWKILCPLCVQNYVERSVLDKINAIIVPILAKNGNVTIQKNNPIQR